MKNLLPTLMAAGCDSRIGQNKYHTNNLAFCTPSKKAEESSTLKAYAIVLFLVFWIFQHTLPRSWCAKTFNTVHYFTEVKYLLASPNLINVHFLSVIHTTLPIVGLKEQRIVLVALQQKWIVSCPESFSKNFELKM